MRLFDTGLLLARGRDRLETAPPWGLDRCHDGLLLARGRDRLETKLASNLLHAINPFSYSLGDAIDWKRNLAG